MKGTMRIVINKCYGGFGLSAKALKWMADKENRPIYFFVGINDVKQVPIEECEGTLFFTAYDVPEIPGVSDEVFKTLSLEDRRKNNEECDSHCMSRRDIERTDPLLIECVETLGDDANGMCAELKIIEIPDGIDYEITEYDGLESIKERHRSWS